MSSDSIHTPLFTCLVEKDTNRFFQFSSELSSIKRSCYTGTCAICGIACHVRTSVDLRRRNEYFKNNETTRLEFSQHEIITLKEQIMEQSALLKCKDEKLKKLESVYVQMKDR